MEMNYKAFKELRDRYYSITMDEIREIERQLQPESSLDNSESIMKLLTGFGDKQSCTLCAEAIKLAAYAGSPRSYCNYCLWAFHPYPDYEANPEGEYDGENDTYNPYIAAIACIDPESYATVRDAEDAYDLLQALQDRVEDMDKIIDLYLTSDIGRGNEHTI